MNYKIIYSVVGTFALLVCLSPARSADSSAIVGTWRITGLAQESLETKEITRPFGDQPVGYMQYSAGGHMVTFLSGTQKKPDGAWTDAEALAAYRTIIAAYAATYRIEGNQVVHH